MTEQPVSGAAAAAERTRQIWSIGSYTNIAPTFLGMAAHLIRSADVASGETVLDVACGTGNAAITACRRGALVMGLDITPSMLKTARDNAELAEVPAISWCEGDATVLPFEADCFDVTLSCVGHMFAEPPEAVARELCRVTKPGGRLAFTAWTPESVVPAMGSVIQEYLPPDPDPSPPPVAWGDPDVVKDRLGDAVDDLTFETGTVLDHAISPEHYWAAVAADSGLFIVALETVNPDDRAALRRDVIAAVNRYFDDRENAVRMAYRATTATVS